MKTLKRVLCIFLFFSVISVSAYTQNSVYIQHLINGVTLYDSGSYAEAALEFRRAQNTSAAENDWASATYWLILSELAYSDYGSALLEMAELEKKAPATVYNRDMLYHRGRIFYNQGYFENALVLFRRYIDSVTETSREAEDRKAAAYYWMGECLFSMGQFDEAERFYSWVLTAYPNSPKKEISTYRIDLIRQKKIEQELLALLQWSHEESLRTSEEYQRRLRSYEYTLNAYQRRIIDLTQQSGAGYDDFPIDNYYFEDDSHLYEDTVVYYIPYDYDDDYLLEYDLYADDEPYMLFDPTFDLLNEITIKNADDSYTINFHIYLLQKARELGLELEQLINEYEHGALW